MFNQTKTNRHLRLGVTFLMAMMLSIGQIFAQNVNVSGKVTDQNGEPVAGAAVFVKGTKTGTSTNVDGTYSLKCSPKAVLVFQSVGYGTIEVPVNNKSVVNAVLRDDANVLSDVVITAEYGQKRVQRSVGSAVQNVKATDIQESGREAFVSALQGRVAGITVSSTGGAPGASTSVILRSVTSVSGNNQPLYVIDGVPMNNNTFDSNHGFANPATTAGENQISGLYVDFSSRGNDLNPEDIESMTILKGAAAAVLYGSDASNGAIVITTKKGQAGQGKVTYSNKLTWSQSYGFPKMQKEYANGQYGVTNYYMQSYFGGRYPTDGSVKLYDNVKALLQTGFSHNHDLAVEGGTDKVTVRGAVSYLDQKGTVKTTDYTRLNITLSGRAQVTKWLNFDARMQYTETTNTKARKGINQGVFRRATNWPMVDDMRNYLDDDGVQMKLPYLYTDTDVLNPLYDLYKNKNYDESKRFLTTLGVNITPTKNTFISARMGWDASKSIYDIFLHPYFASRASADYGVGYINISKNDLVDKSMNILAGYNNQWGDFNLRVQVGYHQQENGRESIASYGSNFQVKDFYSLANCDPSTILTRTIQTKRRLQGISGAIELGWKNMAFLNFRGRNDWSSTLPKNNRSYFYPAIEASFIATELPFLKNNDILSYLKLRSSFAQVGKDASPNAIYPALESTDNIGGGFKYGYTGPNETLKPEMNNETEVGFEARLFNDRVNMDFSYFWRKCKDQYIEAFRLSYATGFVLNNMNVGTFKTWGWEFHIDGDILRTSTGWRWNVGLNLDHNDSKVTYLPENVSEYYNAYTWLSGNLRNGVKVGYPVFAMTGRDYQRNDKGQILVDPSDGGLLTDPNWSYMGDRNPKLKYGITSSVSWKNFRLSMLLDGRFGATVVNGTMRQMLSNGLSPMSVYLRQQGQYILRGVLKDGHENSDNPTTNHIVFDYSNLSTTWTGTDYDWLEKHVNYLRMKEIRFQYTLPKNWLKSATHNLLSAASVWISANDLFTLTNYSGVDAVGNSNSAAFGGTGGIGIDAYSVPTPRSLSVGINLTF
jgi:TonB-linked SusC/RagA family outer membrane protein